METAEYGQGEHDRPTELKNEDYTCSVVVVKSRQLQLVIVGEFELGEAIVDNEHTADVGVEHKEAKVTVVIPADAIVDPRTVMIHFQDTAVAYATVVRSLGLTELAFVALLYLRLIHY